jgi:hypothetical protein
MIPDILQAAQRLTHISSASVVHALWVAHPILESCLAVMMLWRKEHRKFPIFFAYVISQILNFMILYPVHEMGNLRAYFYVYWIAAAISVAIGFRVIHEIFLDIFRPYHTLKDLGTVLFKWAALVMLLVALVMAVVSPGGQDPVVQAVIIAQRCVRVIQCGLTLFLLVFSQYLGVSWRQQSFGIALGFGGFASTELIGVALRSGGQIGSDGTLALLNTAAYTFALLTWIGYASVKSSSREAAGALLVTQRWEQSLGDLQHSSASEDSLIPMFEGMVERAFSRTPQIEQGTAGDLSHGSSASTRLALAARAGPAKK